MKKPYLVQRNKDRGEAKRQQQLARYSIDSATGCWIWAGGVSPDGYGKLKRHGKTLRAHRVFYEHFKGPIPEGHVVMHSCDTPLCVNPDHLKCGTVLDNEKDKDAKGRRPPSPSITHPEKMPRGQRHPRFGKGMAPHIKEALRKANLGRPLSTTHKENLSTLSIEQVQTILQAEGSDKTIAALHGVSRSTVQRIKKGLRWSHVRQSEETTL